MCAKFVFNFPQDNYCKVFKLFEKFATKMEDEGPLRPKCRFMKITAFENLINLMLPPL